MYNQLQSQKLQHKVLPQQIALLNLLKLDTISMLQRIEDEVRENPALEETALGEVPDSDKCSKETVQDFQNWEEHGYDDIPDYKTEYGNYFQGDKMPHRELPEIVDFRIDLKKQFRLADNNADHYALADFIIDSLNDDGLLGQDLVTVAEEISFMGILVGAEKLKEILAVIRQLEPPGVGCEGVREFLLLQLVKLKKTKTVVVAISLLEKHFADLCNHNIEKIRRRMHLDQQEFKQAIELLGGLKSRPVSGSTASERAANTIIPEFIISMDGDELHLALARQCSAGLHISQSWMDSVKSMEREKSVDKNAQTYMRNKLASANWFIKAVREREENILKVIKAIVNLQENYFLSGDLMELKPMVLKNVAEITGLDISTVSRITSNKYADTHFGIILLRDLFTEGLTNKEGASISNRAIQTIIQEVIQQENKKRPYTDRELVDILSNKGYVVARRTIAKYRMQLNLPVAQLRAVMS